jgi:hypothetical protein
MSKLANRQPTLKAQDLYVLLALAARGEESITYPELAAFAELSMSEVHGALKRAEQARLLFFDAKRPTIVKPAFKEFLFHGAKYAFPPARVTYDVDLIAEVTARHAYYALEGRFAERGFSRDISEDAPICRWRVRDIEVDLMPTDEKILGFSNRWYPSAAASATSIALPSGRRIS